MTCSACGGSPSASPARWRISIARVAQRAAARRRAEDHRVAGLGRDDRLEQRGRGRVRDRQQRQHDADRLGDVLDRALGVLLDHADRALVLEVVVEELGGDVVLDRPCPRARRSRSPRSASSARSIAASSPAIDHRAHDPVDVLLVGMARNATAAACARSTAASQRATASRRRVDGGGHCCRLGDARERRASASSSARKASARLRVIDHAGVGEEPDGDLPGVAEDG